MASEPVPAITQERQAFYDRIAPLHLAPLWEKVHHLVGLGERRRAPALGRVEHHELHHDGEHQQHEHPGPRRATRRHGGRDGRALPHPAHTGWRAATAARTASATTWLTSGWNTLGMM